MTHFVYSSILFLLFFIINEAIKPDDPLQGITKKLIELVFFLSSKSQLYLGTNSVCADVCTSSEPHVELDLSEPRIYRENERVQINLHHTGSGRCREPGIIIKKVFMLSTTSRCSCISFCSCDRLTIF